MAATDKSETAITIDQAARNEEREMLENVIRSLPEADRVLIEMRQKEGRAFAEIARRLNISEDSAQKRWARALQSLQEKVKLLYGLSSG